MENKNVSKENTDIRTVGSELGSVLCMFARAHGEASQASEETKASLKALAKEYCNTILAYVDLF